jgi:hypothetical protein
MKGTTDPLELVESGGNETDVVDQAVGVLPAVFGERAAGPALPTASYLRI